ncbi:hypothetical protein WICMUC_001330 [Wickerhamomyces mucosus]|uniref:4-hydroxy-3-methoxy-5-polyprenylbenzoate decarboxylase n=1 Tax=Wickerhamomyces mucosus TaxID=1378264 RepID=A0A9P8PV27_9ASCO|nr:hypothetical protein WICMUC_001330 [Wickerhamomyces mucosus]
MSKRSFIIPAISALTAFTQSNFFKDIQLVDKFEQLEEIKPKSSKNIVQESRYLPDGRIKLSNAERFILAGVSGISSFLHPEVGYNINNFGEATAIEPILRSMRDNMLLSESGRRILKERPLLNNETVDPEWLKTLPKNTLGYQYHKFTKDGDERAPVKFIEDEELAYVFLRYRQIHDIAHILMSSNITLAGELPVKAFEFGNTGLPMTGLATFAYFKLSPKRKEKVHMIDSLLSGLRATPLYTVYWEKLMERDLDDIRKEVGVVN